MPDSQLDIVTQLQESLDRLSVSLFSTTGALQRDAQAASVRGEPAEPTQKQVQVHTSRLFGVVLAYADS